MKIAYTISGLYNSGGMENILIQKANYLADILGYNITIITTDQKSRPSFFSLSHKVNLIDLGVNYQDAKQSKLWHLKKLYLKKIHQKALTYYLKNNNYDIVISLMDFDFSFLYKIKDGSKKILEYHFAKYSKVNATNNIIKKIIQKCRADSWDKVVANYDKFIVLTKEDKEQWKNLDNVRVIPNFIKKLPNRKAELRNKRVISVGRADFQKGFDMLIDAWSIVSKNFPDWILTIIGGGDKASLQNQINKLCLSDSIKLLPPNPDIEEEYLDSSLYVMSSRFEGLPLVLLEAMSFGLPIVSFNCPCGPKDILKPDFSSLVDSGDIKGLARELMRWINNYSYRKEAQYNAIREANKYTIEKTMKIWDTLFIEVYDGNK